MKKDKRSFGKILMILLVIFFYAPILYMIIFSFNEGKSLTSFTGFSLRWYQHMLESRDMMSALYTTFTVAILATLISTVVGTIAAIGLSSSKKLVRDVVEQVNNFPIMNPDIVTGVSLLILFLTIHMQKGFLTLLIAHITFNIPYVILSVLPKLKQMNEHLFEAAQDLGCNSRQAFFKVVLPEIMPGVLSGFLMSFTFSLDDFIISYYTFFIFNNII